MQGQQKPQVGIFSPEDLKKLEDHLKAGDTPGESNVDRENRATLLIQQDPRVPKELPDDLEDKAV